MASTPTPGPPTATPTNPIPERPSEGVSGGEPIAAGSDAADGRNTAHALNRCVGDTEAFRTNVFGAAPHLHRSPVPFDDLLSLGDVDRAISGSGLRHPALRLVRDGRALDPATFTRPARTGATRYADLVDPGRVLDRFADGATIVLQSLHRWWPPVARFCRGLELEIGHPLQANAYLTPPGAAGLAPHHDTHDVFVLQVAGTKHWTVRAPVVAAPLPHQRSDHDAAAEQPVLFEADLEPGDALYLPRGYVHSAAAQQGAALHLTLGVLAATAHNVLRRVVDRAGDDPAFRRQLPAGYPFDRDLAVRTVKAALADLVDWIGRLDPGDVADDLTDGFFAHRAPLLDGQLGEMLALEQIDDGTRLRRRAGTTAALDRCDDGRLRLTLGDRRVVLPAALEPAVRRLVDGRSRTVGDLADLLDGPSRVVLARRLVREGALCTERSTGLGPGTRPGSDDG